MRCGGVAAAAAMEISEQPQNLLHFGSLFFDSEAEDSDDSAD